ncbi:hypothetical protein [Glaciihabitans sp. UYNi722]|uniref:hypothetical protein n=1 Tax=Glaciihabitans sp. UYNi722 TaxID=3156344 RepID=UPI003398FAED
MPEAPRERPGNHTLLHSFAGHVLARPKAVFDAIDGRLRPSEGSESLYTADSSAFFIISQGGWWYRGEYRIVPDEKGSNIEHYIVNVAQKAHRLGPVTGRKVLRHAPLAFERLLRQLRAELE